MSEKKAIIASVYLWSGFKVIPPYVTLFLFCFFTPLLNCNGEGIGVVSMVVGILVGYFGFFHFLFLMNRDEAEDYWGFCRSINIVLGPLFAAGFISFVVVFLLLVPSMFLEKLFPNFPIAQYGHWVFAVVFVITFFINLRSYIATWRLWKKGGIMFY